MNKPKNRDAPSTAAWFRRIVCSLLPTLLLGIAWSFVVASALQLTGEGGDLDDLIVLTFVMVVGTLVGIQMTADLICCWPFKRLCGGSWLFTLLSTGCVALFIVMDISLVNSFGTEPIDYKEAGLIFISLIQSPIVIWFLVNVMRWIKKERTVRWFKQLSLTIAVCTLYGIIVMTQSVLRDTAFINAVQRGDVSAVSAFLCKGIRPDAPGMVMNGRSALELAAQTGDSRMVRLLLSHGAVPGNALMAAVVGGRIDTLDLIAHAQPKPTRNQRAYAIEEATREGKMDFVRILNKSAEAPDSTSRSGRASK